MLAGFPEPFTHAGVSLLADLSVPAMLWLALAHPLAFAVVLLVLLAGMATLVTLLFRVLRTLFSRVLRRAPGA